MFALLTNKYALGAIGAGIVLFMAYMWYQGQLNDAFKDGYSKRQGEIEAAHRQVVEQLEAENDRLRASDQVRVETVIQEKVRTEKVIEYIEKEIPVVDTSQCFALSADWVRVYNAAARANCRDTQVSADCPLTEAAMPTNGLDAGWGYRTAPSLASYREEFKSGARLLTKAPSPY